MSLADDQYAIQDLATRGYWRKRRQCSASSGGQKAASAAAAWMQTTGPSCLRRCT